MENPKYLSFPERKLDAVQLLIGLQDETVLAQVYATLLKAADDDANWYENLTDDEKASIKEGEADIAAGRVISQEDLMAEARTWIKR